MTPSIGLMSLNLESEQLYFTEVARRASLEDVVCYQFIPTSIEPATEMVRGQKFNPFSGEWEDSSFSVPDILYDRCFFTNDSLSRQAQPIVTWLKSREDLKFIGNGVPNRLEILAALSQTEIAPYLPVSKRVVDSLDIIEALESQKRILIKPVNGTNGDNIYYIELRKNGTYVKTEKKNSMNSKNFSDLRAFLRWLDQLLLNQSYFIQAYHELMNESGHPFDIRIVLHKTEDGTWKEKEKKLRIGKKGGLLSSNANTDEQPDYNDWLNSLPALHRDYFSNEAAYLINKIPTLIEEKFHSQFELRIDMSMARDGSVWILGITIKPGQMITHDLAAEFFRAPVLHAQQFFPQE